MQSARVLGSQDFFLEQKVDDASRIDVVDDRRVHSMELELQQCV